MSTTNSVNMWARGVFQQVLTGTLLAAAAVGCGSDSPEACEAGCPSGSSTTGAQGGGGAAGSPSGAGGDGGHGGFLVTDLFVDPIAGDDAAPGSVDAPLKTLKKAISIAVGGQTVHLFSGTYDAVSGEDFAAPVPDGVAITAVVPGQAVLAGTGVETALDFAGSGSVEDIVIEGFHAGVFAMGGEVFLRRMELRGNYHSVYAGAVAMVTLVDSSVIEGEIGLRAAESAAVVMTGGEIRDMGSACGSGAVVTTHAAHAWLDGVHIHDSGQAVRLDDASSATFKGATIEGVGSGCAPVMAFDASKLRLEDTVLTDPSAPAVSSAAVWALGDPDVTVIGGSIAAGSSAIYSDGSVSLQGTHISGGDAYRGIQCTGSLVAEDTLVEHFNTGVYLHGWGRFRGVQMEAVFTGIEAYGDLDLGTSADPGGNTFQWIGGVGLDVHATYPYVIDAIGNFWIPNNQGTGPDGMFPLGTTIVGPFGLSGAPPRNVVIHNAGPSVKLAADILP